MELTIAMELMIAAKCRVGYETEGTINCKYGGSLMRKLFYENNNSGLIRNRDPLHERKDKSSSIVVRI